MEPQKEEDLKHTNEFGEIDMTKDTEYWFKRDFGTIKKSFLKTLKAFPFVVVPLYIFFLIITRTENNWNLRFSFGLTVIFSTIILLGYFMVYILVTKGYDIQPYQGTHIDNPNYDNRFSVKYILNSQMSTGRKFIFILRLFFYIIMLLGLLFTIFKDK